MGTAAWVGVFALLNFLAGILPYQKSVAGLSQRMAMDIRAHTPPRALIVVSGVGDDAQCEVDVPYFANRPILSLHGLLTHSGPDVRCMFWMRFGAAATRFRVCRNSRRA